MTITDTRNVGAADEVPEERLERTLATQRVILYTTRLVLLACVLVLWHVASGRWVKEFWISSPGDVYSQLGAWIEEGTLFDDTFLTLQEMLWGFLLGAGVGVIVGFILGWMRRLAEVVNPFIIVLNSIPKIAIAPLLILWLGIGMQMKVVLAAIIVFFLVFYNTYSGVRDVNQQLIDTAKLMGAKRWTIFRYVVLPSAMTMVFAGLRVSVPYAFLGAVVGEMLASNRGIGFLIMNSSAQFNTAGVFAGLVVLMVLASVINGAVGMAEKRLLRWRVTGN